MKALVQLANNLLGDPWAFWFYTCKESKIFETSVIGFPLEEIFC